MEKFGRFLGLVSVGPARTLGKAEPKAFAKFYLLQVVSVAVVLWWAEQKRKEAYRQGFDSGRGVGRLDSIDLEDPDLFSNYKIPVI